MNHPKKRSWTRKLLSPFASRPKEPKAVQSLTSQLAPTTPAQRCGVCFFALSKGAIAPAYTSDQYHMLDMDIDHHIDSWHRNWAFEADFFRQSAARGCKTCAKFCHFFCKYLEIQSKDASGMQRFRGTMKWEIESFRTLTWTQPGETDETPLETRAYSPADFEMRLITSGTSNDHDHPVLCDDLALRSSSTGSEKNLKLLKAWLSYCTTNHEGCAYRDAGSPGPKRLLHIRKDSSATSGEEYKVILTESVPNEAPYVSLSHCWGTSQPLRLLKSNLVTFQENIPWDSIPRTFKDAMGVVLYLGVEYIWIDSLCIVQDDPSDWQVEASKMLSVYENSYITIAATASGGSSQGLFSDVSQEYLGEEIMGASESSASILLRLEPQHQTAERFAPSPNMALMTRGWVFQERLVSPRIIHFAAQELMWECRTFGACKCIRANQELPTNTRKQRYYGGLDDHNEMPEVRKAWYDATEEYSGLKLTFHTDRLTAIAGIAKQFARTHGGLLGEYLGGLWANCLPTALFWELANSENPVQRPSPSHAPTWSWASIIGRIQQPNFTGLSTVSEPLIDIISIHTTPIGPDEFGQLESCNLTVRGYALEGQHNLPHNNSIEINGHTISFNPDCLFESSEEDSKHKADHSILVLKAERSSHVSASEDRLHSIRCLILRCVDRGQGHYERMGSVQMAVSGPWAQNAEIFDLENKFLEPVIITLV